MQKIIRILLVYGKMENKLPGDIVLMWHMIGFMERNALLFSFDFININADWASRTDEHNGSEHFNDAIPVHKNSLIRRREKQTKTQIQLITLSTIFFIVNFIFFVFIVFFYYFNFNIFSLFICFLINLHRKL